MDLSVDGWTGEYVCAFGEAMAYENCVVSLGFRRFQIAHIAEG